jgi:SAM-dependent methyltransferase
MNLEQRAHGVTPGLRADYGTRTAAAQAGFALPYLRPGMSLLDVGCGPGSITVGLAEVVAPGAVVGVDHDAPHIERAREMAALQGAPNLTFLVGDARALPLEDGRFEAAFENDVLTHLGPHALTAAREIHRVLQPGGIVAARDVDTSAVVWGHRTELIDRVNHLFTGWMERRGSDLTLGSRLPAILRAAGFVDTVTSVSADTKGTPDTVAGHGQITLDLLEGPFGRDLARWGWVTQAELDRLREGVEEWRHHPDAFFANVHVEVVGYKPAA